MNDILREIGQTDFSGQSLPVLIVTCVLLIALPVGFWLFWRAKHREQTRFRYLLIGAAGFLVSARVLELGVHLVCIVADNPVSRFINGNHAAYVLYGIVMAGVFEECGRYVILRFLLKKPPTRENAVLYGIGHGGIEVLTVTLPVCALYLAIAVLFSGGDVSTAFKALNITEETAAAALPSVKAAAAFGAADGALFVAERALCMLIHVGLTVIVFYGVRSGESGYLPLAVGLHMAADVFPALYQRGLVGMWVCELWLLLWTGIIVFAATKLYRRMAET